MGLYRSNPCLLLVVVATAIAAAGMVAEAQQGIPSCAASLAPCAEYLNSTSPPPTCCGPLNQTLTTQLKCLCNLYSTPGLLKSLGIDVAQALLLPKRCKIDESVSNCNNTKSSAAAPNSPAGSGSLSKTPPGALAKDSNDAGRIAGTGLSALLFFWVSMMLH